MKICFVGNKSVSFSKNDYKILNKNHELELIEPAKKIMDWPFFFLNLRKKIKRNDIVFCWFAGWHSAIATYFARKNNKKSIVVVGGYDAACEPEINYGAFSNLKESIAANYVFKNSDLLLPVSKFTDTEMKKRMQIKNSKIIYNGVDTKKFSFTDDISKKNIIICVGVIKKNNLKRKGLETFVKASKILPQFEFYLIGSYDKKTIEYLKSINNKNITYTGHIPDVKLLDFYKKAKVVCQLSYYEAFGLAPAEGMAMGCIPVVTKERNGMIEFVKNHGKIVNYGNEKETAKAIEEMLNINKNKRDRAIEEILNNFSLEKRKIELEKAIERI